jgi:hypothetical protein
MSESKKRKVKSSKKKRSNSFCVVKRNTKVQEVIKEEKQKEKLKGSKVEVEKANNELLGLIENINKEEDRKREDKVEKEVQFLSLFSFLID